MERIKNRFANKILSDYGYRSRTKNTVMKVVTSLFRFVILVPLSFLVLYPIIYMISSSFMPSTNAILDPGVVWVPKVFSLDNFKIAINVLDYWKSMFVTMRIEIVSGLIEVFTCAVAAYGLARFKFKQSGLIFVFVMLTIIIPPQAILIPTYLNNVHLDFFGILGIINKFTGVDLRPNIIDTAWTFYLPALFGVGYRSGLFIFIYRQFFKGLPKELEEASWIDGYGPFKTFLFIVLPSSGPAILCVSLFSIIWHWNEFYLSGMLLFNQSPLSVSLSMFSDNVWAKYGLSGPLATNANLCACLLAIVPVLVLYLWLQKFFMKSIESVGIVG